MKVRVDFQVNTRQQHDDAAERHFSFQDVLGSAQYVRCRT